MLSTAALPTVTYYIVNKIECVREGGGATSPCGPCVVRSKMNKDQVPVEGRGLGPGSGPCTGNPFPVEIQTDTTENITFPLLRWRMVTSNKSEE